MIRQGAVGSNCHQLTEGIAMRYYFLGLGALVVICTGCSSLNTGHSILSNREHVAPPAGLMQRPGPMVDGPGPGVIGMLADPGMGMGMMAGVPGMAMSTQVRFVGPESMTVGWQTNGGFANSQVAAGDYYDFQQSAVYQLMLDGVTLPGLPVRSLYPTLEVRAAHPNTLSYLQHNAVPVEITEEDLEQVNSSNMVTKVIYLPDPEFQARAIAGVETLVSTRLDPGIDPVQQAESMGTIMVILRFGNKDLQPPATVVAPDGSVTQVSYSMLNGEQGQVAPPMPIQILQEEVGGGVPSAMIAAGGGIPGQPSMPVAGMGSMPPWGMPITGTPIGLPGPAHLPLGGPAGLKSHTVRNLSNNRMPEAVDHMLIDVKHDPGYSVPDPVRHIQYTESHPVFGPGQVSAPLSGGGPGMGAYCPPY
ncbi:MAG: hypothetical protein KDA81_19125 [Planctomycetaceae bacterium]|nr:hypothetical protein [Planctomycetaceae bacterium]